MNSINCILDNYSQFFSWDVMISTLLNPSSWAIIITLVIMEGLLSADNALVLAMMVKHLPEKEQRRALTYGIWGAYIFRFLAIGVGTYLIKIWWVKLIAAGYLLELSVGFFLDEEHSENEVKAIEKSLWGTVIAVELMDIAFSIDSVAAAFGVSSEIWVLYLGAIFGILMMRGVAKVFVALIDKVPELESGAYILIAIIGFKMLLELFHVEVPEVIFFLIFVLVLSCTFVLHKFRNAKTN
ncbi:membrane protein [Clostridium polyendosporum]|uniref:Membrane protein n=1 Tax=Clostridium polyendosporum TaxID=69208 RepID=A0A919RXT6_9CLOT|nr:TerC family protein [Clostridium polyendosporum]GIM28490.1 membrane protein [Clostridium polyendosporum]